MDGRIWERKSGFSKYFCLRKFSYGPTQNKLFLCCFPGQSFGVIVCIEPDLWSD